MTRQAPATIPSIEPSAQGSSAAQTIPAAPDDKVRTIDGIVYRRIRGRNPYTEERVDRIVYDSHVDYASEAAAAIRAGQVNRFTGPSATAATRFRAAEQALGRKCIITNETRQSVALDGINRLFDTGECFYKPSIMPPGSGFAGTQLLELVARHAAGDLGAYGNVADVVLDDDRRWCPELFGPATVAARAIETGVGLIASTFEVVIRNSTGGTHQSDIEILTLIGTSQGNITLIGDTALESRNAALGTGAPFPFVTVVG
jgi:hypothetical protein